MSCAKVVAMVPLATDYLYPWQEYADIAETTRYRSRCYSASLAVR